MAPAHAPYADAELAAFQARPAGAFDALDIGAMREGIAARAATRPRGPEQHAVHDVSIDGLRARLYRPTAGARAVVVYLHGGGWCVGDVASFDRPMRRLAARAGVAVLAVDYRLAPEHPWPASIDDTVGALRWIAAGPAELDGRPPAVAVAGDSAGAALAALACLRLRDEPATAPDLQVLLYGNFDLTGALASNHAGLPGGLDLETERFFQRQWMADERRWTDGDVSALHAASHAGLPPALVVSAELDPLRDDSSAYADALRAAGTDVELRCEPGLVHNFLQYDEISPACAAAADRIADDVAARLR